MSSDVYIDHCEKCGSESYGIMTSSFETIMTILYECPQCGHTWSDDRNISRINQRKGAPPTSEKDD